MSEAAGGSASADAAATDRVLAVVPELSALERARDRLPLGDRTLLHAGPPLPRPDAVCTPVLHAAVAALLFEGWTGSVDEARRMVRGGAIELRPAQDLGCVLPLADVLSPSMWVQVVRDAAHPQRWACSPIHGGPAEAMRTGVFDAAVVAQLHWLDQTFAPAFRAAVAEAPLALIPLADESLDAGDDCHGKTAAATAVLAGLLHARFQGASAPACRAFLERSPGFFLNLWMAASRCMLSAAAGTAGSSVVVAAGGNGLEFGIQLAGRPGRWCTAAASPPVMPGVPDAVAQASLGAIGDSAIVDLLGFGAMTTLASTSSAAPAFASVWPGSAQAPRRLLYTPHPAFARSGARVIVQATEVSDADTAPVVSLGVLDKMGLQGRLGGGFYRTPHALFADAAARLQP